MTTVIKNNTASVDIKLLERRIRVTTDLEPQAQKWQRTGENEYETDLYELKLRPEVLNDDVIGVDILLRCKDGGEFSVKKLDVSTPVSMERLHKIWSTPDMNVLHFQIDMKTWGGENYVHGSSNDPVLMGLDDRGINLCSIGMAWTAPDTLLKVSRPSSLENFGLTAEADDEKLVKKQVFLFSLSRPAQDELSIRTREYHDGIFFSLKRENWFHTLKRYAGFVDKRRNFKPRKLSPWALSPCLAGFGAGEELQQEYIEQHLPLAKELGFGSIHIDIAWTNDAAESQSIDDICDGYYEPSKKRFPDFKGMVKKLEENGMVVEVHVSGPFIGKKAPNFEKMKPFIMRTADKPDGVTLFGRYVLCPRTQALYDHLVESMRHMVGDLGIKSFWHDFHDDSMLPNDKSCISDHKHAWDTVGQGWDAIMKGMAEAAWEIDPNVTFTTRRTIANINNKPYLTHMCAFDSPYDYVRVRREAVIIRSYGDGITPCYGVAWPEDEADDEIAKRLASLVFTQVPKLSVILLERHLKIVRAWLGFYRQHAADMVYGDLEPLVFIPPSAALRIESEHKTFVGCFDAVPGTIPMTRRPDEIYVFNGACREFFTRLHGIEGKFKGQWHNYLLEPVGKAFTVTAADNDLILKETCILPSLLKLERV